MEPNFSIITPVKNDELIFNLIYSLRKNNVYSRTEHIIVTNGATREFIEKINRQLTDKNIKVLNLILPNLPEAINQGIKQAKSENVVILDSDCEVNEGFIKGMDDQLMVFFVVQAHLEFIGEGNMAKIFGEMRSEAYNKPQGHIFSPGIGFNKNIFKKYGYFDIKSFHTYDSDFSYKLKKAGVVSQNAKGAIVYHTCTNSLFKEFRVWFYYGTGRFLKYSKGYFGKTNLKTFIKSLYYLRIFNRERGIVYNFFVLVYLIIRDLGFIYSFTKNLFFGIE